MQKQPNADPMGRRNSTTRQRVALQCVRTLSLRSLCERLLIAQTLVLLVQAFFRFGCMTGFNFPFIVCWTQEQEIKDQRTRDTEHSAYNTHHSSQVGQGCLPARNHCFTQTNLFIS